MIGRIIEPARSPHLVIILPVCFGFPSDLLDRRLGRFGVDECEKFLTGWHAVLRSLMLGTAMENPMVLVSVPARAWLPKDISLHPAPRILASATKHVALAIGPAHYAGFDSLRSGRWQRLRLAPRPFHLSRR